MAANLDVGLLLKIMGYLGEHRDIHPNWVSTTDLLGFVPDKVAEQGQDGALFYIDRHCIFLIESGYLQAGTASMQGHRALRLTARGNVFVQPELAEFGREAMLPQVVKSIEDRIEVLTYPQEEKDSMRFRLREALSKRAPDFFAKVVVEIASKVALMAATGSG